LLSSRESCSSPRSPTSPMLESVRGFSGLTLSPERYLDDFWPHFRQIDDVLWKLERIQDFREPEEQSWAAMMAGDWAGALDLIEHKRDQSRQLAKRSGGFTNRRLRIVEHPVTPYLQWEMHILRIRVETGEQDIKVLDARVIEHLEQERPLPELLVLGRTVMYEVLYDDMATLRGARRIDDPGVIRACRKELARLFEKGEDLLDYFDREIASMPPPKLSTM
jgi:hypothetical protein